jgi:hypothetical protein
LVGIMRSLGHCLTLLIAMLFVSAGAATAIETPEKTADPKRGMLFHTLDGDSQEVNADEIWRVRQATGIDEPKGAVVIDYAFERLYVQDSLDSVVSSIRDQRKIEKFSSPSGAPIYILPGKVIGIARALPDQHHPNSKSIIIAKEGQQQVRETRDAVREALGK